MSDPSMPVEYDEPEPYDFESAYEQELARAPHPPQDLPAEQSVLGGMMLNKDAIGDVDELISARDFYRPAHQAVFDAILTLYGRGEPADAITVAAELEHRGELQQAGGAPYLHTLIATVPTAANAAYYAEIVKEKATLRRLVEAGTRVVQLGYHGTDGAELDEVVDRAQAAIHEATVDAHHGDGPIYGGHASAELIASLHDDTKQEIIPTGFADLDAVLDGYARGEVTVVCGRPGHGKTMLGVAAIKAGAINAGFSAFVFSLEMSRKLLFQRLLAATPAHGVDLSKLKKKLPLDARDWTEIERAHEKINEAKLWIDDSSYQTTSTIRTTLRRHIQQHGTLDVVVIDYLGLLESVGKVDTRALEIQKMTRDLKVLAGELDVAIVLLHQLNRKNTERADRRPQLSDLRDSGAVEQDAFAVVAVQNFQVDDPDTDRVGEVDLLVLKNRQGPTATVTAAFQARFGRIVDMAKGDDAQQRASMSIEDRVEGPIPITP